MCKLSIIMPVYNTARFLDRSVDSILNQTMSDWELIMVDDGSTDESGSKCDAFAQKDVRIKVIHKLNGGAGSARNSALEVASGEYVAFPDSDDWIDSDAYSYCIDQMDKKGVDLLLFGSINTVYTDDGRVVSEKQGNVQRLFYESAAECRRNWCELVTSLPMDGPSNKIYKMSILKQYNLRFPNIRRMQDGVFNMYYFDKISSFMSIEKSFYHFTQHSSDFQRKKMPKDFLNCAITYHRTAIQMLKSWGEYHQDNEIALGKWLSETVCTVEFEYLPSEKKNKLKAMYNHIKNINNNDYIHNFMVSYCELVNLSKKETAIKNQWNMVVLIYILLKKK